MLKARLVLPVLPMPVFVVARYRCPSCRCRVAEADVASAGLDGPFAGARFQPPNPVVNCHGCGPCRCSRFRGARSRCCRCVLPMPMFPFPVLRSRCCRWPPSADRVAEPDVGAAIGAARLKSPCWRPSCSCKCLRYPDSRTPLKVYSLRIRPFCHPARLVEYLGKPETFGLPSRCYADARCCCQIRPARLQHCSFEAGISCC